VRVAALVGKVADLTGATRVCFAVASLLLDVSRAAAAIGVNWRAAVNACLGLLDVAFVEGAGHTLAVLRGSGLDCKIWVGQHTALPDDGHLEMSHLQESARGKSSAAETAARKRERMVTAFMMMMWVDSERLLSRMKMIWVKLFRLWMDVNVLIDMDICTKTTQYFIVYHGPAIWSEDHGDAG
jgi:hypothetical protein